MNTLIVTVGLPRSGKTTWSRTQSYPIVNPDSIRLAIHGQRFVQNAEGYVWAVTETMIRALFLAGHDKVILDATNVSRKRRDRWQSKEWETRFKVIDTPKSICLERAKANADAEIIPIIERMASELEALGEDEKLWETMT